jgi:hypothetical protein
MRRVAYVCFDPKRTAGVEFRCGRGLVGVCIKRNTKEESLFVDFESAQFRRALQSKETWDDASMAITRHLSWDAARKLAERYSQAVAFVIQDENSGEALGALTLSLPAGSTVKLTDPALGDEVMGLASTASLLSTYLNLRNRTKSLMIEG